jgi:tetratricopeptide (TPR) repeat protein
MNETSQNSTINQMRGIVRARRESLTNSHQIGLELLKAGEYEKAATIFRKEIVANPNFSFSHHYLGEALDRLGQDIEAEKSFIKSAELNPYFALTQMFLGDTTLKKGAFSEAETFYRRAVELNPKLFGAYKGLLKIYYQLTDETDQSKWTPTDEIFLRSIELALANRQWLLELLDSAFPDAEFYIALGDGLRRDNQTDSAAICYQLAVTLAPERAEIWLKIARVFFEAGENEYATECQSQAATLTSDSVEIHTLLGEIWSQRKGYAEAIAAYQQALELEPKNAEFYKIIGDLQTKQGLINDARISYQRAIELGYKIY